MQVDRERSGRLATAQEADMSNSKVIEQLIAAIFHVLGRSALPVAQVRELVGRTEKNRKAFNMCDGRNTQQEISRRLRMSERD